MEREVEYVCAPRVRLVEVELIEMDVHQPPVDARTPLGAVAAIRQLVGAKDREHFIAMHLNARHRVASIEIVSKGILTMALVHPREVLKGAILANAAAIIVAHNHPSGDTAPSPEDLALMSRLHDAAAILGIPLLDFLIVAQSGHWAARETAHWPSE